MIKIVKDNKRTSNVLAAKIIFILTLQDINADNVTLNAVKHAASNSL
jgi:hypothetical protein